MGCCDSKASVAPIVDDDQTTYQRVVIVYKKTEPETENVRSTIDSNKNNKREEEHEQERVIKEKKIEVGETKKDEEFNVF